MRFFSLGNNESGFRTLKVVKGMLMDATHPVELNIIIDDRKRKKADATVTEDK